tara:strand:+ start:2052 stop:3146 length:1095 start_codon:yes stop_codon:yes gene_type:complete
MKKSLKKYNKKIIFFCPSIEEGGVEKNLINICNGISINRKISIITANKNKKKYFNKSIKFISSKSNFFNSKIRLIKSFFCVYLLLKNYKNERTTLVSFQSNIFAIIFSKLLGYKVIIRSNQSPNNYARNLIKKIIMAYFYKKADKIIVNSQDFKQEFKKFFNLNPINIYNLIEPKKKINKLSKYKIKNCFFSNSKKIINILSVGRLVKQKDQITILRSLNLIKNKKKFRFYLIGKGKELNNLNKYINNNKLNNKVRIISYQNNIYPYYLKSDVFIMSSLYEGLPNTLIEALTLGVPIISSDCKTGPREILNKQKYGKLFKIGDYKSLSKLIIKIKKKRKAVYLEDKRFNFKKNLQKYSNLIYNL